MEEGRWNAEFYYCVPLFYIFEIYHCLSFPQCLCPQEMIPHPHVKNSKLLLGKAGVITTIEEDSPPPPPKHDDKVKPGVRKNEEKKFE